MKPRSLDSRERIQDCSLDCQSRSTKQKHKPSSSLPTKTASTVSEKKIAVLRNLCRTFMFTIVPSPPPNGEKRNDVNGDNGCKCGVHSCYQAESYDKRALGSHGSIRSVLDISPSCQFGWSKGECHRRGRSTGHGRDGGWITAAGSQTQVSNRTR